MGIKKISIKNITKIKKDKYKEVEKKLEKTFESFFNEYLFLATSLAAVILNPYSIIVPQKVDMDKANPINPYFSIPIIPIK